MKCLNCDSGLTPSKHTSSQKYCSDKCRKAYARNPRTDSSRTPGQTNPRTNPRTGHFNAVPTAAEIADPIRKWTMHGDPDDMGALTYDRSNRVSPKQDLQGVRRHVAKWTNEDGETPNMISARLAKEQMTDHKWVHEDRYVGAETW